jgi:hypothetical protein
MSTTHYYTSKHGRWVTPLFFALAFYGFGAGMMDSFAIYPTWRLVGPDEFAAFHKVAGARIQVVFVLPLLIMTLLEVLMLWHRPVTIPRWLVWIALTLTLIPWLSSAFIQIPIQVALDNGKDDALLERLIITDWIRIIPFFLQIITVFRMLTLSIQPSRT